MNYLFHVDSLWENGSFLEFFLEKRGLDALPFFSICRWQTLMLRDANQSTDLGSYFGVSGPAEHSWLYKNEAV